jgi:hypothetical protein
MRRPCGKMHTLRNALTLTLTVTAQLLKLAMSAPSFEIGVLPLLELEIPWYRRKAGTSRPGLASAKRCRAEMEDHKTGEARAVHGIPNPPHGGLGILGACTLDVPEGGKSRRQEQACEYGVGPLTLRDFSVFQ